MKISDGAVKFLKEKAARTQTGVNSPLPAEAYGNGVEDGITILAQQILEYITESE